MGVLSRWALPFETCPPRIFVVRALFEHMTAHPELINLVRNASDIVRLMQNFIHVVQTVVTVDGLQKSRAHAKRSMGVQLALEQILSNMPAKPDDMPRHARTITHKLAQKGIGANMIELPTYLQKVLQKMNETKAEATPPNKNSDGAATVP